MVVATQVFLLWWISRIICLWLLLWLLCSIRHVWFYTEIFLLRVYGLYMLWYFPCTWNCRFFRLKSLCSSHIWIGEMWVVIVLHCKMMSMKRSSRFINHCKFDVVFCTMAYCFWYNVHRLCSHDCRWVHICVFWFDIINIEIIIKYLASV